MIVFTGALIASINTPVEVLVDIPAQGADVVITNGSATNPIFLGSSNNVTTGNGAVVPPYGIVTLRNCVSSNPLYVVAGAVDAGGGTKVGVIYGDLA